MDVSINPPQYAVKLISISLLLDLCFQVEKGVELRPRNGCYSAFNLNLLILKGF